MHVIPFNVILHSEYLPDGSNKGGIHYQSECSFLFLSSMFLGFFLTTILCQVMLTYVKSSNNCIKAEQEIVLVSPLVLAEE